MKTCLTEIWTKNVDGGNSYIMCRQAKKGGDTIKKLHKHFVTLSVYACAAGFFLGKGHKIHNKVSK